ncbi:MAG: GyrI-like domain-containing protein [Candidatus Latescibacteria bacterium]|nr:GyrI-like domain-containing protein [Candidatus Latescibacterota bacterium]
MPYTVALQQVAPRRLAAAQTRVSAQTLVPAIRPLFDEVYSYLNGAGIRERGLNVIIYWNEAGRNLLDSEEGLVMEAGVEVEAMVPQGARVHTVGTPAGRCAGTVHRGPSDQLGKAHEAVRAWCAAQGLHLAGPNWEVYGHWNDDPQELRTEVFYLLSNP